MGLFNDEITTLGITEFRGDPLDNPSIPLSSPAAWELFGASYQTESGEVINDRNALSIVTVWACVNRIAQTVGSLPLKLMERTDTGHKEAVEQNLYYLLGSEPNPDMDASIFFETLTGCTVLTGNGYAQIERNDAGQPIALWPLHPFKTTPKRDPRTLAIYYETSDGMPAGQLRRVSDDDVLHFRMLSLDGLKGISPIDACRRTLGLATAQEKSGARYFGNGSRPGGLLINKGNKLEGKALQEMRQSWEAQQGAINQGRIAVIPNGDWSYQSLSISNEASQWLQSRQFSQSQIAQGIFNVPPHMVGDMSRLSGSNSEQMSLQFRTSCIQPYLSRIEGEIVRKLIPRMGRKANKFFVRFDDAQLLRCDFKTTMEGYSAGIIGGWYSANDVRRKLGENPGGPELDVYRVPVNYQNAENIVTADTEAEAPMLDDDDSGPDSPTDSTGDDASTQTANAQRKLLGAYKTAYFPLYHDAFNRIMRRSKRDLDAFSITFRAVLECISCMAIGFRDGTVDGIDNDVTTQVVNDVLKSMTKRASKWPVQVSEQEMQSMIVNEFNKAVRSIHIAVSKTIAASKASQELIDDTEKLNRVEDQNEE